MSSTFLGLTIAYSGLTAANAGINVTTHNISNCNTVGYCRQVVSQEASKPIRVHARYGTMGAGVTVTGITQIRDTYYDYKYWTNQGSLGEYTQKSYYMKQIEDLYFSETKSTDDSASGFTAYYGNFTNALETMYTNPSDTSKRAAVIQSAQTLSTYFNDTMTSLDTYQNDTNLQIEVIVNRINSAAENIAALNKQIKSLELNGTQAKELRDKRANVVDDLSQYVGVEVIESFTDTGSSSYTVKICNQTLVDGFFFNTLEVTARDDTQLRHDEDVEGLYDITWSNKMNFCTYNEDLTGTLKGYLDIRDGNNQGVTHYPVEGAFGLDYKGIPYYKEQTNLFAKEYTREFNKIQMQGQGLNEESTARIPFFSLSTMTTDEIKEQADKIYNLYQGNIPENEVEIKNADGSITKWKKEDATKWVNEKALEYAKEQHPTQTELDLTNGDGTVKTEYLEEYLYGADYVKNGGNIANAKLNPDLGSPMVMIDYITDQMTAGYMSVNNDLILDNDLVGTTGYIYDGVDSQDLIKMMATLKDKNFMINGTPEEFMEGLVAVSSIDSNAAKSLEKNYQNISNVISNQRLSISGVDEDEEAVNLIKYQHAYGLAAKCISVMSEVYNKLINETAV